MDAIWGMRLYYCKNIFSFKLINVILWWKLFMSKVGPSFYLNTNAFERMDLKQILNQFDGSEDGRFR